MGRGREQDGDGCGPRGVLPLMTYGWAGVWTWAPDLALVVAALAVSLALTAVLRLVPLIRARGGRMQRSNRHRGTASLPAKEH